MKFLVYSSTNDQTIRSNLGGVDYSYYFVLKRYLPLLQRLGTVEVLEQPLSAENEGEHHLDDDTWYLSFTPPNMVDFSSSARTVPVFAWEFGTLPDEAYVSQSDNWKHVLDQCGQAITHSGYAVGVVRESLGESYPIVSIPAPVWDDFEFLRLEPRKALVYPENVAPDATILDSRDFILPEFPNGQQGPDGRYWLQGSCDVLLPDYVHGAIALELEARLEPGAQPSMLELVMAGRRMLVKVSEHDSFHSLLVKLNRPVNTLRCSLLNEQLSKGQSAFSFSILRVAESTEDDEQSDSTADLARDESVQWLGAHSPEDWGRWTEADTCSLILNRSVAGKVRISFNINLSMMPAGHVFNVRLGQKDFPVTIADMPQRVEIDASGILPTDHLEFSQLSPCVNDADARTIGLSLSDLNVVEVPPSFPLSAVSFLGRLLTGLTAARKAGGPDSFVTYTTVFNPIDGRKNWPDIIKAFVFALRDYPDAMLLIKLTHSELQPFVDDLTSYFRSLAPFSCRVVFIHGYLEQDDYADLVRNTSYIVNASRGEGQCLPLMEYMSSGVPAISPDNTAMADYVTADNAFVVRSTVEPAVWPQDPRMLFRTTRYRINWESLYRAFQESYRVAKTDPQAYRRMSDAAIESLQAYCSMDVAEQRLRDFLGKQRGGGSDPA